LSTLTIDRIEAGKASRLDTKRKILHALGLKVSDKEAVFGKESLAADVVVESQGSHGSSYSG
jgi:hypothetical protein